MDYDVVIVPTFMQVDEWRKRVALERPSGLFGLSVSTFNAWIADLWELHGDGRRLVDSAVREALMLKTVSLHAQETGCELKDLAPMATQCVRSASGVRAFEQAMDSARCSNPIAGLSVRENVFMGLIGRYRDVLQEKGLIEPGEAAARLASLSSAVFPRPLRVLVTGVGQLSWIHEQFFSQCDELQVTVIQAEGAQGIQKAPKGTAVRFAFPAGRLAQPGLVADLVSSIDTATDVVVACKQPLVMFEKLESRLLEMGRSVRMQATKPFTQTDFGRAFFACYEALAGEAWNPAYVSDAVSSFFSGFSKSDALKIDEALRKDRIACRDQVFAQLRDESELFAQLEQLAREVQCEACIDTFVTRVQTAMNRSAAWRAEQLDALRKLRSIMEAARFADVDIDACAHMASRASVAVAVQSGSDGAEVRITTTQLAAALPQGKYGVAIATDLTAEDYPVAEKEDALFTLVGALGLNPEESALEKARREFTALLALPAQLVVLSRPLGDADADETYPAVVLEELVDAYRLDPSDVAEVGNAYRLPRALQEGMLERGEELLFANAYAGKPDAEQPLLGIIERPQIDGLDEHAALQVAPKRRDSSGNSMEGLCLSPSQIEAYLECPYLWFANRRLRITALDEGFGPLERGSFAHAVLETFYRRFQEAGHAKVNAANLPFARELMREVTRELSALQYELEPGSGRFVATNEIERREVLALCDQLVRYLDFEAQFLPEFHPAFLEYEIDVDHAIDYAGCKLVGKVDRIDVDDRGNAVVVDYKGSVNAEHEISGKLEGHCGKVQTRIYAQAVKRALGLNVVAALYVSYGRTAAVAGAYDPRFVEAAHLPGVRADKCSCGLLEVPPEEPPEDYSLASLSFSAMLDETESIVSRAMAALRQGALSPQPAYSGVCEYCPVTACPKRGA